MGLNASHFSAVFIFLLLFCIFFSAGNCLAGDYKIAPADVLEISIWGEQELTRQLVVRPDGKVSFPLIGDIEVAGKTTTQVKSLVEKKIQTYIPSASATVIVSQLGSLQYYVIGKVAKPGMFNVSRKLSVLQALAMAGGLTTFADEDSISVIRYKDGKVLHLPFNYSEMKEGKNLQQDVILERGDVVLVP